MDISRICSIILASKVLQHGMVAQSRRGDVSDCLSSSCLSSGCFSLALPLSYATKRSAYGRQGVDRSVTAASLSSWSICPLLCSSALPAAVCSALLVCSACSCLLCSARLLCLQLSALLCFALLCWQHHISKHH